jgi:hypothetical protein
MAGTVSGRSRDEVVEFGQQFAIQFGQLNDTCRRFFSYISGRVFKNMQEWRSVLSDFKNSVLDNAWGSRSEKQAIYRQIENFLLDPTNQKVVAINSGKKGRTGTDVSHYLMHLLTDASSSLSAKCVVCKSTAGIIVKCSQQRCTKVFHTFCAAAVTHCKHPPSEYYRCREHAGQFAAVEVTTTKKKRSRQGKPPTKNEKKSRVATANEQRSEDETSTTNPATPDGNKDEASAGIAGADADTDADADAGASLSSFASDNTGGSAPEVPASSAESDSKRDEGGNSLHTEQNGATLFDHCIFEGFMFDASSTPSVESEGSWIEGLFNVRVHNILLEHVCGFYSLLEAAKCLPASYGLILPDDALSLRKAIVDFIATNLDTYCERGMFSRTWYEEIALRYFPENPDPSSPKSDLMIWADTGLKERVLLYSINDYLEAMALPGTHIDECALLAFARMWDVRVVVFRQEGEGWTSDNSQFMPEKYLDEKKSIYLVQTDQWVTWAHADEQDCGVESCRESGKRISAHHKLLNFRCNDESVLPSAMALTALPSAAPSNGNQHDLIQPCEELPTLHDVSSDLGGQIEGLFNVCVHNTLLEDSCGLVSLLEAAKCLDTSYGLIVSDDAASLRTAIVDFIAKHLDTCCEGECSGISRTWREMITLRYFPEKQDPVRELLNIHTGTEQEEEVVIENMNDYLKAMAMPRTRIDDIALLALARMWDVRVVIFWREANRWTSDKSQFMPEKYLDAKKSIYLVWTPPRIIWAHADGQKFEVASCKESGKRISAHHKFLNYEESALYSAKTLKALPNSALSKGKHRDPDRLFEELSNPAALLEGVQAGREANMLTGNVDAKANTLSEACEQLDFAKSHLANTYDDMQASDQAKKKSKKHEASAVKKEKLALLRTGLERVRLGFVELNNLAKGIQTVYKMTSVPDSSSTDITEYAIRILVALDSGLHLTSSQVEEWYDKLRNRSSMLRRMYHEKDFEVMVDETIGLLKQYSGRQILVDRDFAVLHEHLKTYGWVLSPQMWTREEITVMCVILLDPKLMFNSILQKNISEDEEKYQNRGMACLDPRVQAIMYSRLKQYKFVLEDSHLPIDVPAAVVLNSGGSYLQMGTWEYSVSSRFVVDNKVDALLFEVIEAPKYTRCNGVYIATKTRRLNGQPVYVGISPTQFFGLTKKENQIWNGVPMSRALSQDHVLREYFDQEDCEGQTFAAERVLFWENGQAVFQSVTAYGTDMKLMTIDCETLCSHFTSNWSRIENFDFKKKKSIMVAGSAEQRPSILSIKVKGTIKPDYTFACGTERIVVPVKRTRSENKPTPTKKQIMHKDGPTLYDNKQFDERGNILPDAREYTQRRTPLPPGISVSALFAFFCRTFLGIKPVVAVKTKELVRSCASDTDVSLRLHASIGRAIIFNFDTDHQV